MNLSFLFLSYKSTISLFWEFTNQCMAQPTYLMYPTVGIFIDPYHYSFNCGALYLQFANAMVVKDLTQTKKLYFSGDHSDLWNCGLSISEEQLGSVPDNPIVLFMGTCTLVHMWLKAYTSIYVVIATKCRDHENMSVQRIISFCHLMQENSIPSCRFCNQYF